MDVRHLVSIIVPLNMEVKMKSIVLMIVAVCMCATATYAELSKETVVDKMEVLSNGSVQVREAVRVLEDGKLVSQQFHRYVVSPGDDYSKRDAKVQAVCAKVQTAEVIAAYQDSISENTTPPVVTPGLVKETKVNKIHILEDGTMVSEKVTRVLDDGKEIGKSKVIEKIIPGTDVSAKTQIVKDVAEIIQTKKVIDTYTAAHPAPVVSEEPIVSEPIK